MGWRGAQTRKLGERSVCMRGGRNVIAKGGNVKDQ